MNFSTWLDFIMNELSLSNVAVARAGKLDRSLISRYRSGKRVPASDHVQLKKLLNGILILAKEENPEGLDALQSVLERSFCESSHDAAHDTPVSQQLQEAAGDAGSEPLAERLYRCAVEIIRRSETVTQEKHALVLTNFPRRLDELMHYFSLSNVRLAHALNIDSSLVSRWRSGMRLLRKNNPVLMAVTDYFAERILNDDGNGRAGEELREYLDRVASDRNLQDDRATAVKRISETLREWLTCEESPGMHPARQIDPILDLINTWEGPAVIPPELSQRLQSMPRPAIASSYTGITGLRQAVIRFLRDAALSDTPRKLKLFSNQAMGWMVDDPEFTMIWSALMRLILSRGHQIEIIHHLSRTSEEIFGAVENWLPLYMCGAIAPYTCDRLNLTPLQETPLVKTLFIDVGHAAINGELIQGTEDIAMYRYETGERALKALELQFDYLRNTSEPLLDIRPYGSGIKTLTQFADASTDDPHGFTSDLIELNSAVPFSILDPGVLEDVLSESDFSAEDVEKVQRRHRDAQSKLEDILSGRTVHLIFPIPEKPERDRPCLLDLSDTGLRALRLNGLQTAQQRQYLNRVLKTKPKLHLHLLPEAPFDRLRIVSLTGGSTSIVKCGANPLRLELRHRLFRECMEKYLRYFIRGLEAEIYPASSQHVVPPE